MTRSCRTKQCYRWRFQGTQTLVLCFDIKFSTFSILCGRPKPQLIGDLDHWTVLKVLHHFLFAWKNFLCYSCACGICAGVHHICLCYSETSTPNPPPSFSTQFPNRHSCSAAWVPSSRLRPWSPDIQRHRKLPVLQDLPCTDHTTWDNDSCLQHLGLCHIWSRWPLPSVSASCSDEGWHWCEESPRMLWCGWPNKSLPGEGQTGKGHMSPLF